MRYGNQKKNWYATLIDLGFHKYTVYHAPIQCIASQVCNLNCTISSLSHHYLGSGHNNNSTILVVTDITIRFGVSCFILANLDW